MSIEFEAERQAAMQRFQSMQSGNSSSSSKFVQWLMNKGIVSSEAAGQRVLVSIVGLNILLTVFIIFKFIL
jgi:hypothetical protein